LHELPKGDVLIHAGDISNKGEEKIMSLKSIIKWCNLSLFIFFV